MIRLLKIEFEKLFGSTTVRVFVILYFLLMAFMAYLVTVINPNINGVSISLVKSGAFDFPQVWQNVSYFADFGSYLLAVIIISSITNEYSYRTLKQNIIDGLTKREFMKSKLGVSLLFALLSTFLIFVSCVILGLGSSDKPNMDFGGVEFIFAYFVKLCVFFSFCTFLAFAFRKSGFAFITIFIWIIGERILLGVEKFYGTKFTIANYFPMNTASDLLPFPKIDFVKSISGKLSFLSTSVSNTAIIVSIIYTFIFISVSYWLLRKRDL